MDDWNIMKDARSKRPVLVVCARFGSKWLKVSFISLCEYDSNSYSNGIIFSYLRFMHNILYLPIIKTDRIHEFTFQHRKT